MKRDSRSRIILALLIILIPVLYGVFNYERIPPKYSSYQIRSTNYSGLPTGEHVRVYPTSHVIKGDSFQIVYENWRLQSLYWGSDWKAEKMINGEWVEQEFNWAWTAELRTLIPFCRKVDTHNFPFDDGLYRITKKCMLTDVYLRDQKRWESEFTATFYLIKTS